MVDALCQRLVEDGLASLGSRDLAMLTWALKASGAAPDPLLQVPAAWAIGTARTPRAPAQVP